MTGIFSLTGRFSYDTVIPVSPNLTDLNILGGMFFYVGYSEVV
jgi:hypothetical protein